MGGGRRHNSQRSGDDFVRRKVLTDAKKAFRLGKKRRDYPTTLRVEVNGAKRILDISQRGSGREESCRPEDGLGEGPGCREVIEDRV